MTNLSDLTPGAGGGAALNYQEFTSNGTWTKPDNVTWVEVEVVGGGGGGASGRKGASNTRTNGGSGGWGSPITKKIFAASSLGSTESITIAAGGTGGASVTADSTNGNDGADGGTSSFGSHLTSGFGTRGKGGDDDGGGTYAYNNTTPFALLDSAYNNHRYIGPGGSRTVNYQQIYASAGGFQGWCGSGGGGGAAYNTTSYLATPGSWNPSDAPFTNNAGSTDGESGGSISAGGLSGAGGGAPNKTGDAGAGGNAAIGGGGAGGGASFDGQGDSGAGGNGGDGRIRVWSW